LICESLLYFNKEKKIGMTTGERYLQIKCNVNTRMPLSDRLTPLQGTSVRALSEAPAPRSALLQRRHPVESTYNASLRSAVRSAADVPPRAAEPKPSTAADSGSISFLPISSQRAEYNAGAAMVPTEQLGFYSAVRKQERLDESAFGSSAKGTRGGQRTVDMLHKREMAAEFRPPRQDWSLLLETMSRNHQSRSSLSDALHKTTSSSSTSSTTHNEDSVRNYRPPYNSTYQTEFRSTQTLVPRSLDDSFRTQRAAVSNYSSSRGLFFGTPKSLPEVSLPNFMGHVPHHASNRAKMLGDGVEILRPYSKCTVNLASSKGVKSGTGHIKERSEASIATTVMGFYTEQAVHASLEERSMNRRAA
jgi:hypothetical protein